MVVGALVALVMGVTGCSSGDDGDGDNGDAASDFTAETTVPASAGPPPEGATDGGAPAATTAAPAADGAESPTPGRPVARPLQTSQAIITAAIAVRVDDIAAASGQAVTLAEAQGGFLFGEQTSFEGRGSSQLVLRVPPEGFRPLLGGLAGLGDVLTQHVDAQDVSDQVVDLEARIGSASTSVERLTEFLLERTGSIEDLARIEAELAHRETALEVLLGQQRVLGDKIAYATITVSFEQPTPVLAEVPPPPPLPEPPDDRSGFRDGLRTGWSGLLAIAVAAGAVAGIMLPFAPVLALAAFVAWRIVGRRRRAHPSAAAGIGDAPAAGPVPA